MGNEAGTEKKGGKLMQAYCMKCRAKREMQDARSIKMTESEFVQKYGFNKIMTAPKFRYVYRLKK